MTRGLSAFVVAALVALAPRGAGEVPSLEQQVSAEIEYAVSSGIAGLPSTISAGRVWVPVTPTLATILEETPTERLLDILKQIQAPAHDPERAVHRRYVAMCLMLFPEREHGEPSIITFANAREERVVYYKFPLERLFAKRLNQSLEPTSLRCSDSNTPSAIHPAP
jgi:hypothetical protein